LSRKHCNQLNTNFDIWRASENRRDFKPSDVEIYRLALPINVAARRRHVDFAELTTLFRPKIQGILAVTGSRADAKDAAASRHLEQFDLPSAVPIDDAPSGLN
jgi:hypothetical protein